MKLEKLDTNGSFQKSENKVPSNNKVSQDIVNLYNQQAELTEHQNQLDISGYSVTANISRIDKKKYGIESKRDSIESQKQLSGFASTIINSRKLQFKKPRPVSENSNKTHTMQAAHTQLQASVVQSHKFEEQIGDLRAKL